MIQEENKSYAQLIVAELLSGNSFKSRDISEIISKKSGKEFKQGQASAILSRISNKEKSDLGFFIHKYKEGNAVVYTMAEESLEMTENHAYGLTLKTGKKSYTLQQAVQDYPGLRKYFEPASPRHQPVIRVMKQLAEKGGFVNFKPSQELKSPDRKMEISIRYSSQYALSVTASLRTFIMICCALVLAVAACCFILYSFIYPILITIAVIAAGFGIGMYFLKSGRGL